MDIIKQFFPKPDEKTLYALSQIEKNKVKIISPDEASEIYNSQDSRGHYHSAHSYYVVLDPQDHTIIGIDNSSGDAWTEEFKTLHGALRWLVDDVSYEDVQREESGNASFDFSRDPADFENEDEKPTNLSEKIALMGLEAVSDDIIIEPIDIGGVHIIVDPALKDVTVNEAVNYVDYVERNKRVKSDHLTEIKLSPATGNNINIDWTVQPLPFERIRRITGYLVGDLNRWNNAKRAEEHDRVKHISSVTK